MEYEFDIGQAQKTIFPGRQIAQTQLTVGNSFQFQHRVTDKIKHFTDLALSALVDCNP